MSIYRDELTLPDPVTFHFRILNAKNSKFGKISILYFYYVYLLNKELIFLFTSFWIIIIQKLKFFFNLYKYQSYCHLGIFAQFFLGGGEIFFNWDCVLILDLDAKIIKPWLGKKNSTINSILLDKEFKSISI